VDSYPKVFVVESSDKDLILGSAWEREVMAKVDNRKDGSRWYTISSPDEMRKVTFEAVPADHPRNRYFAREKPVGEA
jgi:hypothetical protein